MLPATPTRVASTNWIGAVYEDKQRRRLLIAAILLLAAITAILVRDYESSLTTKNEEIAAANSIVASETTVGPPPNIPAPATKALLAGTPSSAAASKHTHSSPARANAHPANKSVKGSSTWGPATVAAKTAVERARTSDQAQTHLPAPSYPLLTQATAVRGAVLLQALIAADGTVQEMRVISGPTILVSAAREAVQQWRFKPYLLNGKPVETYARVTVNFTIDVSDTEARYKVNSVTSAGAL